MSNSPIIQGKRILRYLARTQGSISEVHRRVGRCGTVDLEHLCRTLDMDRATYLAAARWAAGRGYIAEPAIDQYAIENGGIYITDEGLNLVYEEQGERGSEAALLGRASEVPQPVADAVEDSSVVFVVHGRDETARQAMFHFLRALGLRPLEWSQAVQATGEGSPYVGTVLDTAFSMAQAVVVLMTPDDEARLREELRTAKEPQHEIRLMGQARANVLFEAGMAMGRDSDRTILVEMGTLRPFSDVGGRHVVRIDNTAAKRKDLAQRLETAGCPVDLTGDDWLSAGDFAPRGVNENAAMAKSAGRHHETTIVLGDPVEYPHEYADLTHLVPDPQHASSGTIRPPLLRAHKERVTYRLYRVPVTSEGGDASNVFVQLAKSTPPFQAGLANPLLHLAGDNPDDKGTYRESKAFALANAVPREIDVIAITKSEPYRCFIFKVASADAMEEHPELDGQYVFRLVAPGGAAQDYTVHVDLTRGTLSMARPAATGSNVGAEFWLEPGAPTFRVNPGTAASTADTIKLLMTFAQISGDEVTPVIEWSGANIQPSQPLMMPQNQRPGARYQKCQLKPALARPSPVSDQVTFDIRFRWHGATRQYRWSWSLYVREKGIWGMNSTGENTREPKERTTLD